MSCTLKASTRRVQAALEARGFDFKVHQFPESTRTSAPDQANDDSHRGNPQPHTSNSGEVQAERNLENRPRHHPSSENGQDESRCGRE